MSKKEVEKNEEGWFKKWLDQTDRVLDEWVDNGSPPSDGDTESGGEVAIPRAPTYFERNLEVWRQLSVSQLLISPHASNRNRSDGE